MKKLNKQLQELSAMLIASGVRTELNKQIANEIEKNVDLFVYQEVGMPQQIFNALEAEMQKHSARIDALSALLEAMYDAATETESEEFSELSAQDEALSA